MKKKNKGRLQSLEAAQERVRHAGDSVLHGLSGHGLVTEGLPEFSRDHEVSHTHPFRKDPEDEG